MDSVLRKLGLKKGDSKESECRKRLQKELFAFQRGADYGFPYKPSAISHDPSLGFLAIGTSTGALRIYGRPGVQFSGQHSSLVSVDQIVFLPEQARLVTLCSDCSLHLWELNTKDGNPTMDEIKTFKMDPCKAKTLLCCCLSSTAEELLLGTESGAVYAFNLASFDLGNKVFTHDLLLQNASDDMKANPGAVEVILRHPSLPDQFLIGFGRGVLVLVNSSTSTVERMFSASQQLESASFQKHGAEFVTSHSDGSYVIWKTDDDCQAKETVTTPYGPFPCKAITKIISRSSNGDSFLIFSGGMPRASFGDRNTVTVIHGEKHVVFDLTSKVIDFLILPSASASGPTNGTDEVDSLVILAEEELVSIDLRSEDWPLQRLPYLANIHSSAVTCIFHTDQVAEEFWDKIISIGNSTSAGYSTKEFAVNGGKINDAESFGKELLITGHEDGSVLFWSVSVPRISLVYQLNLADFFVTEEHPLQTATDSSEESWPPFRKVGTYKLFSESPRLGIEKIAFDSQAEILVVAGAAGQVLVFNFQLEAANVDLKARPVDILDQTFAWHGPEALEVKPEFRLAPGFHPSCLIQMNPPAPCSALTLNAGGQIFAVGSAYGFLVYDYLTDKTVFIKGSLVPAGTKLGVSRSKSFSVTLRESFRHLRKRPSSAEAKEVKPKADSKPEDAEKTEEGEKPGETQTLEKSELNKEDVAADAEVASHEQGPLHGAVASGDDAVQVSDAGKPEEATVVPIKIIDSPEKVEMEKKPDITITESEGSPAIGDASQPESTEKTEAVATNEISEASKAQNEDGSHATGGLDEKPKEHSVTFAPSSPTKQSEGLGHSSDGSPLCAIRCLYFAQTFITNAQTHSATLWVGTSGGQVLIYQLNMPSAEKRSEEEIHCTLVKEIHLRHRAPVVAIFVIDRDGHPLPADMAAGGHRVLVCSQEQLKIFSLPSLKAYNKYKVSVRHNEAKVTQVAFSNFTSKSDAEYKEKDLVCLTDQGDVAVFTVPHLRLQTKSELITKDKRLSGNLCVLTQNGFGFYQPSPSQLERFSLCAANHALLACALELKEGMRQAEEVVTATETVAEEVAKETEHAKETEQTESEKPVQKIEPADEVLEKADTKLIEEAKLIPLTVSHDGDGGANDSMVAGDITADSIKVHFVTSEETSTVITCHDVIENKMVVTTSEHTVSDAQGVRTETKMVVEEKSSIQEGAPVISVGGQ